MRIDEVPRLVHLTIHDETIITTIDHPFYVKGQGFINAGELQVGDEVISASGETCQVETIRLEFVEEPERVYNFQVEDYHTYHVGNVGVLVHNANADYGGGLEDIHDLDDLLTNPDKLAGIDGDELYDYIIKNGYDVQSLSKGTYKGIPYEEGGGFKVNWGGDRILQYHPESLSHHGGAYFKISSGETGTIRIGLDGNFIE